MSSFYGYIEVADSNHYVFSNVASNDMVIYTTQPSQAILLGTTHGVSPAVRIESSNLKFNIPGRSSNEMIAFCSSNLTRMSLLPNGYVGIGTSNPAFALEVVGTAQATTFQENGSSLAAKYALSNAQSNWNFASNTSVFASNTSVFASNALSNYAASNGQSNWNYASNTATWSSNNTVDRYWTVNTSNVYTLSNVGIGKSNPAHALDVNGQIAASAIREAGSLLNTRYVFISTFNNNASNWNYASNVASYSSNSLSNYAASNGQSNWNYASNTAEWASNNSGGRYWTSSSSAVFTLCNVAIGLSNPNHQLTVSTDAAARSFSIRNTLYDYQSNTFLPWYGIGLSNTIVIMSGYFGTRLRTQTGDHVAVSQSGFVGVGTVTPSNKLHVISTSNTYAVRVENALQVANSNANARAVINIKPSTYNGSEISACNSYLTIQNNDSNGIIQVLSTGSNGSIAINAASAISVGGGATFGVNTASPLYTLDVNGDAYFRSNLTVIGSNADFPLTRPIADNTHALGDASRRWKELFVATATINTSDERLKQDIQAVDDRIVRAWQRVQYCKFRYVDSVLRKGDRARWHIGVVAQRVKAAFEAEGLDPFACGILCYDEWDGGSSNRFGVRYEEALALEAACLRAELNQLKVALGFGSQ